MYIVTDSHIHTLNVLHLSSQRHRLCTHYGSQNLESDCIKSWQKWEVNVILNHYEWEDKWWNHSGKLLRSFSQNEKCDLTIWFLGFCWFKRNGEKKLWKDLYRNVLDSFVQNNKTLEEEFPYSRKWGQQIPLHLYNGPLVHYDKINVLSIHAATWWNFKNIYVKWQKPDTKSTTLCNFFYWNPGMDKTKLLWRELVLAWNGGNQS